MSDIKLIPTTTIAISTLTNIDIYTFFNRNGYLCNPCGVFGFTDNPQIKLCFINVVVGVVSGINFSEGELAIISENTPLLIDYWIDYNGNFIIKSSDSDNYYIDEDGNLIYDFCKDICDTGDNILTEFGDPLITEDSRHLIIE